MRLIKLTERFGAIGRRATHRSAERSATMIFPGAITCGDSDDEDSVAPLPSLNRSSEDDAKKMQDSFRQ